MTKKTSQDLKAEAAELTGLITSMRKKEHNFALAIGKEGGVVLAADPKKGTSVMWRQVKANGGTTKGCMGVASVKGKLIQFRPEGGEEPPKALLLNTKKHLKTLGLAFKVVFILPDGAVVGEDGDDDTGTPAPERTGSGDDAPAMAQDGDNHDEARVEALKQQIKNLSPEITALKEAGHPAAGKLVSGLKSAIAALESGQIDKAESVIAKIATVLDKIEDAANQTTNDTAQDNDVEKRGALETAFGSIAQDLDKLKDEGADKVAQKAGQMATVFWQALDAGDWKKAADISDEAKTFADKEFAVLAAFPAPDVDPANEPSRTAELLELDADIPEQAEKLMKEDLTVREPHEVFDPDHMVELSKKEFEYAGSATLRELMPKIEAGLNANNRETVIAQLADIVGANKDRLGSDYDRYRVLLEQQKAFGKKKDKGRVPPLEDDTFPDFRASQEQLLFGAVLGEVFGIHEVFAALLSPTGGMVGPGNNFIEAGKKERDPNAPEDAPDEFYIETDAMHLTDRHPIGLHGIFHDAAGYLTSYHDDGPGYNYLESDDEFLDTGDPLCGQVSGIEFWVKQIQEEDAQAADEFAQAVAQRADEQVLLMEQQLEGARDQTADAIDDCLTDYEALKKKAGEWTSWLPPGATASAELLTDTAVYGAAGAAELGVDATTRVAEAGAYVSAAKVKIDAELDEYGTELEGTAKDIGFAALGGMIDTGEVLAGSAKDAVGAVAAGAAGVVGAVSEAGDDIGNIAANAGAELSDTVARTSKRLDAASGVLDTADALAGAVSDVTSTVTKATLGTAMEVGEAVADMGASVLDTGADLVKETADVTMGLAQTVVKTSGKLADIALDAGGDAFEAVVDIGDAVGDALGGVADAAGGLVDDVIDNPLTEAVADKLSSWASSFGW
ncbi:hypothetical protein [Tateyamaria sp.]|uniref:hypothetical protein n=1 Tax=Tateyamaria sp. TaxID=1929288 RepID=UPI00329C203A